MPVNCANPACTTEARFPLEGKVFQFEVRSISVACEDAGSAQELPRRQRAQFWLCERCAAAWKVVLQSSAVRVAPREMAHAGSGGFVPVPYACIQETLDTNLPRPVAEKIPDLPVASQL